VERAARDFRDNALGVCSGLKPRGAFLGIPQGAALELGDDLGAEQENQCGLCGRGGGPPGGLPHGTTATFGGRHLTRT